MAELERENAELNLARSEPLARVRVLESLVQYLQAHPRGQPAPSLLPPGPRVKFCPTVG